MNADRVLIVAKKEFIGNLVSRKFFLLLLLLSLAVGIGAFDGINEYYNALELYKSGNDQIFQIPPTPVIIFGNITENLGYYGFGAIVAIALGFNLISGERESGSLKSLLSHPVYRDEVINGKALGGIISLIFAETIVFVIIFALMLLGGIVPDINSLGKICVIWFLILLFLIANFSLALMASAVCKSSSGALIISLFILFVVSYLLPVAGPELLSHLVLGDEPKTVYLADGSDMSASELQYYQDLRIEYLNQKMAMNDAFSVFSIQRVFSGLTEPFTRTTSYLYRLNMAGGDNLNLLAEEPSVYEILGDVWLKISALVMFPVIFFGIAYVRFMRLDLR
ncbi:ABC transporter permease [Methanochimaera problematica]|uniref:ABC transporter permease n=1 Tax=Methanochimaera problematica TaxID=2609417 RepID=UPI0029395089|nr:ABC transporter permease subunit [Methanoplanus sp. FWC-SCC4]